MRSRSGCFWYIYMEGGVWVRSCCRDLGWAGIMRWDCSVGGPRYDDICVAVAEVAGIRRCRGTAGGGWEQGSYSVLVEDALAGYYCKTLESLCLQQASASQHISDVSHRWQKTLHQDPLSPCETLSPGAIRRQWLRISAPHSALEFPMRGGGRSRGKCLGAGEPQDVLSCVHARSTCVHPDKDPVVWGPTSLDNGGAAQVVEPRCGGGDELHAL